MRKIFYMIGIINILFAISVFSLNIGFLCYPNGFSCSLGNGIVDGRVDLTTGTYMSQDLSVNGQNFNNIVTFYGNGDLWLHKLVLSYSIDGYIRIWDGYNLSLLYEKSLGYSPWSSGQILLSNSNNPLIIYTLGGNNFTHWNYTISDGMNLIYTEYIGNIYGQPLTVNPSNQNIVFLNSTGTIFNYNGISLTSYADYDYGSDWDILRYADSRKILIQDIDQDTNYELLFLNKNSSNLDMCVLEVFDLTAGTKETTWANAGTRNPLSTGDQCIQTDLLLINEDEGNWEIIWRTRFSNYLVLNSVGGVVTSGNGGGGDGSGVSSNGLVKVDCDRDGHQEVALLQNNGTDGCNIICLPIPDYSSPITTYNTKTSTSDCGFDNVKTSSETITAGDFNYDGYYDDIIVPHGVMIRNDTAYNFDNNYNFIGDTNAYGVVVNDIDSDTFADVIIFNNANITITKTTSSTGSSNTNYLPTFNGFKLCSGYTICANNTQYVYTAEGYDWGYDDIENEQGILGLDCYGNGSIIWGTPSYVSQATCYYNVIGNYEVTVYLTDTSHIGNTNNSKSFTQSVQLGNCANGYTYPAGCTDEQTIYINIPSCEGDNCTSAGGLVLPNSTDWAKKGYTSDSFDFSRCDNWTIMYSLCPLWYIGTVDIISTFRDWLWSPAGFGLFIVLVFIVVVIVYWRVRR